MAIYYWCLQTEQWHTDLFYLYRPDQGRVDICDQVEYGVHDALHILLPLS